MKYLCLVYMDESTAHLIDDNECAGFSVELEATGRRLGGEALQPVHTATTVRVRNGNVTVTDGPFAETKEQLAGFYMVEASDLNEAIRIASQIPPARVGSIEVRPVRQLNVDQSVVASASASR
ncbi:MAG TPA: YciI family protein [Longimicrobiales bacterium]|nr:YciI family protein [Longimicrobiales bacterium]